MIARQRSGLLLALNVVAVLVLVRITVTSIPWFPVYVRSCDITPTDPYAAEFWTAAQSMASDEQGVIFELNGERYYHPVATIQSGIAALVSGEVDLALRRGEQLLAGAQTRGGALWYPYHFDWPWAGQSLHGPWYSGMAQAQALSLLIRLYERTGRSEWLDAAHQTYFSLVPPLVRRELLDTWIIEYPTAHPDPVFNGHITALFGLYDYWRATGRGEALLCGSLRTALAYEATWPDWYDLEQRVPIAGGYVETVRWQRAVLDAMTAPRPS